MMADLRARVFVPLLAMLVALAWAALWAWTLSPYGRYLSHEEWGGAGPLGALCRAVPVGAIVVPAALSAAAWILMTVAMMLPTTLPLFDIFSRTVAARPDRGRLLALLGLGYVAAWGTFGLLAHALHAALLALFRNAPGLGRYGWLVGVGTLAMAGIFQFSALKYRCLEQCRTPLSFVMGHWRGRSPARDAFVLGAHHGLYCVGCCWALMLLMFVVGMGSLGWMFALAAVMAAEKNLRWGRRLSAPLGGGLLALAAMLLVRHA
jgi:predicted metal-binding membrane protein